MSEHVSDARDVQARAHLDTQCRTARAGPLGLRARAVHGRLDGSADRLGQLPLQLFDSHLELMQIGKFGQQYQRLQFDVTCDPL